MSGHVDKKGGSRMSLPELDRAYLENMVKLLETADSVDIPAEPLTLHRRGHWFEPGTAPIVSS